MNANPMKLGERGNCTECYIVICFVILFADGNGDPMGLGIEGTVPNAILSSCLLDLLNSN